MGSFLKTAIALKGSGIKRSFDRATKDPKAAQERLLKKILRKNQHTVFGKAHAFTRVDTPNAFSQTTPIHSHTDLLPHIERMKAGERNILTAEDPIMYNLTSGTTEEPKYLPVTKTGMTLSADLSNQWLYRALKDHPTLLYHSSLIISGSSSEGTTAAGCPYGSASGMIRRGLPRVLRRAFALPHIVSEIKDYDLRYYVIARLALEKEISFVGTPNPTTLVKIAETGIDHQEEIIRSIREGIISLTPFNLGPEDTRILSTINSHLKPNEKRASHLQDILARHGRLLPTECWKELQLIGCWLGGSIGYQAPKLSRYFGDEVPIRDIGYLASEGSFTVPHRDGTSAGILALQNNYYEFLPENESAGQGARPLLSHELEAGKRYKIILTTPNGLYRYDIHDIIEVQEFYNQTPVISFLRKGEDMLSITGEKLHVNHLLKAFSTLRKRDKLTVTQFRAVPNYDEMRYEILVHLGSDLTGEYLRGSLLPTIDKSLSEANIEYASKRKSHRLNPPCIHVMGPSWEDEVRTKFLSCGNRDIQFKWRMVAPEMSEIDVHHIQYSVQM